MILVAFHRLAAQEYRAATRWYAERSPATATRFQRAVDAAITRIRSNPGALPAERQHLRWVRVQRFPFRLVFEHQDTHRILVLAVAHTSRRPGYWRRRES
jgi:plasmid stabilization system protein ParE